MTDTMKKPSNARVEAVARAICTNCDENPDHAGDARGNAFRWQDYRDTAIAAIRAADADAVRPPQAVQGGDVSSIAITDEMVDAVVQHTGGGYGAAHRARKGLRAALDLMAPTPSAAPAPYGMPQRLAALTEARLGGAVRPPQAVQGGEAVAWISERNELLLHHPDCYGRGDEQWRALYTHPAPAPAAVPVDAIREVIRISDRLRPAWDEVNAWLATSPPPSIGRGCDEAMRKDAERYRLLFARPLAGSDEFYITAQDSLRANADGWLALGGGIPKEHADAAIDAAMAAASNQKGALNE